MKVWFKRVVFALVALAIIALVGGAIFLLTFNPNSYKQKLADIVYQRYHRTLKIDGNIELSLFPRIGLSVQGLSLSDRDSEDPFASLDSARFAVALWPLISNRLVVDHVAVTGFKAWIVRNEDGNFNFDDLLQPAPEPERHALGSTALPLIPAAHAAQVEPAPKDSADAQQDASTHRALPDMLAKRVQGDTDFQIDIAGLSLRDGEIHFYSKRSNTTARLVQLEVNTGRMTFGQPFDVDVKGRLFGDYPSIDAELTGQGQLKLEPASTSYRAQRLDLRLNGKLDQLQAQALSVKGNVAYNTALRQFQATQLETSLQGELTGSFPIQQIQASMSSPRFLMDRASDELSFEKLAVRANGKAQEQQIEFALDAPRAVISPSDASGEPLVGTLKVTGPRVLGLALHLQGLKGTSEKLYFDQARIEGTVKRGSRLAQFKVASPAEWQPSGEWVKLHDIDANLRVEDEASKGSRYDLPIKGVADLDFGHATYKAALHSEAQEATSKLDIALQPKGDQSLLNIALDADRLNIDELQGIFELAAPDVQAAVPEDQAPEASQENASEQQAAPVEAAIVAAAEPLSWMQHTKLQANLKVQDLTVKGLKVNDAVLLVESDKKALQLRKISGRLYEGSVLGRATLGLEHHYDLALDVKGVQLGNLLLDGWGNDRLYGLGDMSLNLQTQGATQAARMAALKGQTWIQVQDGGWRGIDLEQRLHDINDAVRHVSSAEVPNPSSASDLQHRTVFQRLQAQIEFKQGQGKVKTLNARSPMLTVTQGTPANIDMVNGQADVVLLLRLAQRMNAAERKQWQSLINVPVPLRVSGPWQQLQYQVQWQDINSAGVKKALKDGLLELLSKSSTPEPSPAQQAEDQALAGVGASLQAVPAGGIGNTIKNLLGQ